MKTSREMVLHLIFMAFVGHVSGKIWTIVNPDAHILMLPPELNMGSRFTTIFILTVLGFPAGIATAILFHGDLSSLRGRTKPKLDFVQKPVTINQ